MEAEQEELAQKGQVLRLRLKCIKVIRSSGVLTSQGALNKWLASLSLSFSVHQWSSTLAAHQNHFWSFKNKIPTPRLYPKPIKTQILLCGMQS
jgi:hypothetical protein